MAARPFAHFGKSNQFSRLLSALLGVQPDRTLVDFQMGGVGAPPARSEHRVAPPLDIDSRIDHRGHDAGPDSRLSLPSPRRSIAPGCWTRAIERQKMDVKSDDTRRRGT